MFEDVLDVFGICQQDANGQRLFLEYDGEFKHIEFTQHGGEKSEKNVYFCACRRCHFNSTEQLKQEKTKLCMLRNRECCSEAVVNLGCFFVYTLDAELSRPNSTQV